jgi:hypothetical protein
MSLSIRRGLLFLFALVFSIARAQGQTAVPGCAGCTVVCGGGGINATPRLQVTCATAFGLCASCISASSSVAFGRATNSIGDAQGGCTAQVDLAATILGECTAGRISLPTATPSGTGATVNIGSTLATPTGSLFWDFAQN